MPNPSETLASVVGNKTEGFKFSDINAEWLERPGEGLYIPSLTEGLTELPEAPVKEKAPAATEEVSVICFTWAYCTTDLYR